MNDKSGNILILRMLGGSVQRYGQTKDNSTWLILKVGKKHNWYSHVTSCRFGVYLVDPCSVLRTLSNNASSDLSLNPAETPIEYPITPSAIEAALLYPLVRLPSHTEDVRRRSITVQLFHNQSHHRPILANPEPAPDSEAGAAARRGRRVRGFPRRRYLQSLYLITSALLHFFPPDSLD